MLVVEGNTDRPANHWRCKMETESRIKEVSMGILCNLMQHVLSLMTLPFACQIRDQTVNKNRAEIIDPITLYSRHTNCSLMFLVEEVKKFQINNILIRASSNGTDHNELPRS